MHIFPHRESIFSVSICNFWDESSGSLKSRKLWWHRPIVPTSWVNFVEKAVKHFIVFCYSILLAKLFRTRTFFFNCLEFVLHISNSFFARYHERIWPNFAFVCCRWSTFHANSSYKITFFHTFINVLEFSDTVGHNRVSRKWTNLQY